MYYNKCGGYYVDGFDDCLKQVAIVYPDLDLSRVIIDDTIPLTPDGLNDFVHTIEDEMKEPESEAINQLAPKE